MSERRIHNAQAVKGNREVVCLKLAYFQLSFSLRKRMFLGKYGNNIFMLVRVHGKGTIAGDTGAYQTDFRDAV